MNQFTLNLFRGVFSQPPVESSFEVINDSCSHAWQYAGGVLDMVAEKKASNARYERDSYAAWGDADIVKEKNNIPLMIRDERVHVISTVRVKEKLEYIKNDELVLKETMEKRGKPNGNNIEK